MTDSSASSINDVARIHDKERAFHDDWASSTLLQEIHFREAFEGPAAMENAFIIRQMGAVAGVALLDIGAGLGESSVYFALKGAKVTATDISPGMIESTVNLGLKNGVSVRGIVSDAECLNVPSNAFDIVYCANVLHHVTDRESFFHQIYRALKPGGRFFTIDPLAYNPVINIYRKMADKVRTEDECPLMFADLQLAEKYFTHVRHREFWITSLLLFVKYYLVDRVHPNEDRYWKRIYKETPRSLRWWIPLRIIDRVICWIPVIRRLAWNIVIYGEKRA
jgi:2-polyprenyl-3-methyl-5-hydroxy-6-metoxy-1,4-benzoquinol methylase